MGRVFGLVSGYGEDGEGRVWNLRVVVGGIPAASG